MNNCGETMARHETEFKNWFLKRWEGWYEIYEPRKGSGTGMPDVQLLVNDPDTEQLYLLPIEFKVGSTSGGLLLPEKVRPSQVSWHFRFNRAGGTSGVMVGAKHFKAWTPYYIPLHHGKDLTNWPNGFLPGEYYEWTRWEP